MKKTIPCTQTPQSQATNAGCYSHNPLQLLQASVLQPKFEGTTDITSAKIKKLISELLEMGAINAGATTPKHAKVLELVQQEDKTYEISDILDIISDIEEEIKENSEEDKEDADNYNDDLNEDNYSNEDYYNDEHDILATTEKEEQQPGKLKHEDEQQIIAGIKEKFIQTKARATIIWAGGNLPVFSINKYKDAVTEAFKSTYSHEAVAMTVAGGNTWLINKIHQQLDQEEEFCENVKLVQQKLNALGIPVSVYRPADNQFLRPETKFIPQDWIQFASLKDVPFQKEIKNIFVTMGHGGDDGRTQFAADGTLTQVQIANHLKIEDLGSALLYIPLQCHALNAVALGQKQGWTSASVKSAETIISTQVKEFVNNALYSAIDSWLR